MNERLPERFGRSRSACRPGADQAHLWIQPQLLNERIRQYFEDSGAAVAAGEWIQQPEVPTSEEILGLDTSSAAESTAGFSDVVNVPNKKKGRRESKGKSPSSKILAGGYLHAEAYLSAQYELLREDALRPLRETVARVRMTPGAAEDAFDGAVGIYVKLRGAGHLCLSTALTTT